jgi:hypothetical protein
MEAAHQTHLENWPLIAENRVLNALHVAWLKAEYNTDVSDRDVRAAMDAFLTEKARRRGNG